MGIVLPIRGMLMSKPIFVKDEFKYTVKWSVPPSELPILDRFKYKGRGRPKKSDYYIPKWLIASYGV